MNTSDLEWKPRLDMSVGFENHKFFKHLRTFGEAGIVKYGKDGKVGDRGITMVFVGCADGHA